MAEAIRIRVGNLPESLFKRDYADLVLQGNDRSGFVIFETYGTRQSMYSRPEENALCFR